jgi:hypothetical protein
VDANSEHPIARAIASAAFLHRHSGWCVSLFMPTHRAGRDMEQDPIRRHTGSPNGVWLDAAKRIKDATSERKAITIFRRYCRAALVVGR